MRSIRDWCSNKLTIHCKPKQFAEVKAKLFSLNEQGETILDFDQLCPMPEALKITTTFSEKYKLLQQPQQQLFSSDLVTQFFPKREHKRLIEMSILQHWTIGDFIQWIEKHPDEQTLLNFDLALIKKQADNFARYGVEDWLGWRNLYTLWNPPIKWFGMLCKIFPELKMYLSYFESGCWFAGEYISDTEGSYYCYQVDDNEIIEFAQREFGVNLNEDE